MLHILKAPSFDDVSIMSTNLYNNMNQRAILLGHSTTIEFTESSSVLTLQRCKFKNMPYEFWKANCEKPSAWEETNGGWKDSTYLNAAFLVIMLPHLTTSASYIHLSSKMYSWFCFVFELLTHYILRPNTVKLSNAFRDLCYKV